MNGLKAAEIIGLIEQERDRLIESNGDAVEFKGAVRAVARLLRDVRKKIEAAGGLEIVDAEPTQEEPPSACVQ